MQKQKGFTLIEIAIVLVIIGLLLGGILKGQELITNARVRNLITQQDGIKAAFYGFQDRYHAYPGDYAQALANIKDASQNGNGNGRVEKTGTVVNGSVAEEDILVWDHLSHAGFINGTYLWAATASTATSPTNPYNILLQIIYDNAYGVATSPQRHNLKSGSNIPVDIIAEVDRKIDDGMPYTGTFQFSAYPGNGTAPTATCTSGSNTTDTWLATSGVTNCGAASLL
jgi:prepilin-type N-terminal cleavage/methylation domain-containing protein